MDDPKSRDPRAAERKPYEAPVIMFEHPTEALAGVCDGSTNCPSKQEGTGMCDSLEPCTSPNS